MNERRLKRFLDAQGRVHTWPSKLKDKLLVTEYLASQFAFGQDYSEREINERLNNLHTFGDYALLRRVLYDFTFFERTRDGSRYWRIVPVEHEPH